MTTYDMRKQNVQEQYNAGGDINLYVTLDEAIENCALAATESAENQESVSWSPNLSTSLPQGPAHHKGKGQRKGRQRAGNQQEAHAPHRLSFGCDDTSAI